MAQLRQDYSSFVERDAEIIVVGPDSLEAFETYWQRENLPFVGLADPKHIVADQYGQQVKLLKLGRMPALVLIDKTGVARYHHLGDLMSDIVPDAVLLAQLDQINGESQ